MMSDRQDKIPERAQSSESRELRKIAYLYHATGNYAKADEIMAIVQSIESKRQQQRAQDAA